MPATSYELEERVCAGGCGRTFRCLPTSTAKHALSNCEQACKGVKMTFAQGRVAHWKSVMPRPATWAPDGPPMCKPLELTPYKQPPQGFVRFVPETVSPLPATQALLPATQSESITGTPTVDREKEWQSAVDIAREHVKTVALARQIIVKLALKVCDIHWGGGDHWNGFKGVYTMKRFAKEVGIEYKTLAQWMRTWRDVVDHLDPGEWKEEDFKYAQRAIKIKGKDATVDERKAEFRRLKDKDKGFYQLGSIVQYARSHCRFIKNTKLEDLDLETLAAFRVICQETITAIDEKTNG